MRRYVIFVIVPVLFFLDRWTKHLVMDHLPFGSQIEITPFFNVVHTRNYGGAFSLLSEHPWAKFIFTFFPIIIMAVLVYMVFRPKTDGGKALSLMCVLSGALGNLYDRVHYGYVIDFLDFHFRDYHWPAFNVADMAITVGMCLWIFFEVYPTKKKRV
ncbi:MAG: signal peptidase II [Syntrophorhabdaceae bacterium]|nr:signal peptidase II [Syntrophorhabdaceae bacterium]